MSARFAGQYGWKHRANAGVCVVDDATVELTLRFSKPVYANFIDSPLAAKKRLMK